ncbi:MAG TPA: RNA-binding S4 domain-containing protein [Chitinophagaceae bacterium]|nr:RNA-binding S4 domain-containing protein [Chitinophagaceae bacterium]
MDEKEKLRIDKYLWSIRIFKTRSVAADACNSGKVKCNGINIKPSKTVHVGEQYEIKTEIKKWLIEVTGLLHHRVQYAEAIKYYADLTPEEEKQRIQMSAFVFNTGKRKSRQGRPTKKDRRDLDDFFE